MSVKRNIQFEEQMQQKTLLQRLRDSRTVRGIMVLIGLSIFAEISMPTMALALTSGPSSPEFASFEPVATTDMVNDFSGDFTYNLPVVSIPGPDGGGYSMSLSYHSGSSPEEEASWVGFGWTLNPGAVNRSKRGVVDDFKAVDIEQFNKVKPNWTQGSTFDFNIELNSQDKKKKENELAQDKEKEKSSADKAGTKFDFLGVNGFGGGEDTDVENQGGDNPWGGSASISFSKSIRYNNYSGFSTSTGLGVSAMGLASVNMNKSGGESTLSYSVNPLKILSTHISNQIQKLKQRLANNFVFAEEPIKKEMKQKQRSLTFLSHFGSSYSFKSSNGPSVPYSVAYNAGRAYNYSISLQINPYGPLGFQAGLAGSMNLQANQPSVIYKGYGYQYNPTIDLYDDNDGETYEKRDSKSVIQADYQIEKESTFNKHDRNLGIPYNTADMFSATGNGVVGGFQFHHNKVGHFHPNFLLNKQQIGQLGLEIGIGGTIEIGFDVGIGFQRTSVGDWDDIELEGETDLSLYEFDPEAVPQMRFSGDMGGEISYSDNDALLYARVGGSLFNRKLNLNDIVSSDVNNISLKTPKTGNTSFVEYSVYKPDGDLEALFDPSPELLSYINGKAPSDYENLIGQISVINKDGNRTVFGLPVFTRNELELSVGLNGDNDTPTYLKHAPLNIVKPLTNYTAAGNRINHPWASTYLITQTTTFDYVDLGGDGPTEDDFGGWTKFRYTQAHGGASWYKYRAPYTGLFYNRGRLLDKRDQTGSMSSGEKEVYYLKAIETKTHVAFFVTNKTTKASVQEAFPTIPESTIDAFLIGSGNDRKDGLGANKELYNTDGEKAASDETVKGSEYLQNLEKIVLFTKTDFDKPISTTYFEYSYEVCKGTPNTISGLDGKLTLKKVWTEGNGNVKSRISPYQFEYNYFRFSPSQIYPNPITDKYPSITDIYTGLTASMENPNYNPGQLDSWGYFRPNGADRFRDLQPWVDQQAPVFDPAAWQLKRIILPSGGEIHVQYEQKDYSFVQDKKAMAMVNLKKISDVDTDKFGYLSGEKSRYYINNEYLGIESSDAGQKSAYVSMLRSHFVAGKEKLYFKFLYNLKEGENDTPNLNGNNTKSTEYVSGYTTVNSVDMDAEGRIFMELGELDNNDGEKKDRTLPRWVAYRTFLTNGALSLPTKSSMVDDAQDDDATLLGAVYDDDATTNEFEDDDINNSVVELDEKALKKQGRRIALGNTFDYFGNWVGGAIKSPKRKEVCKAQNFDLSYFKLPMYKSKKGGGARVKRILSYDPGIESGDQMVYGTEYSYKLEGSNRSSGVATNEPPQAREENALVGFLERNPQKGFDKLLNGRDSKQFEGPLGEFVLPGAAIGYSRIVMKNIHSGKTTTGYAVNEYHTCKEFPMQVRFSNISKEGGSSDPTYKKLNLNLPLGMININIQKAWVTQGYVFKLNDMHGKPKSQSTYAGNYDETVVNGFAQIPTARTVYNYSKLGEPIKSLLYNPTSRQFDIGFMRPGYEEDLSMYRSKVKDLTNNFSLEIDLNITLPIVISLGFGISYQLQNSELYQHVTTKVLHEQTYMLSTTSTVDGVTQTTENLAFNRHTGDPVLTRTYDGFTSVNEKLFTEKDGDEFAHDGHYYALNIPASWTYAEMGQKTILSSSNSNQLSASVGNIVTYGKNELYDALSAGNPSYAGSFSKTVNASATVMKKNWFDNSNENLNQIAADYPSVGNTVVAAELNKHFYPYRSYVYRAHVSDAFDERIYNGGIITEDVSMFDWISPPDTYDANEIGKWFSTSEVLAYSPHGMPLAEKDIIDVNSTAKFGYKNTLPVLVAQNAKYDQVNFIDYENDVTNVTNSFAHSGYKSFDLSLNPSAVIIPNYNFSDLAGRGVTMKLWVKSSLSSNPNDLNYGKKNPSPQLKAIVGGQQFSFIRVAQTGDWSLYSLDMTNFFGIDGLQDVSLSYNFATNEQVLIDDVRIQPFDAVMNCTVYTPDKKVAVQFDDQHFGIYYDYNGQGMLVRQSIETEKGRRILKEQQQNAPVINR